MTNAPNTTKSIADACVIIAQLISTMDQWSRYNLNGVAVAIDYLRKHAPPDLSIAATARDMMERTP